MNRDFVLINCDSGPEKSLIEELKQLNDMKEVHATLGEFDMIAEIESEKPEKLKNIISDYIRKLEHIKSINTLTSAEDFDFTSSTNDEIPDLIPDIIPEEKKPLEPPEEIDEDEDDFDDEDNDDNKDCS
ncbi:MAG: AsnC family transcription regulator [Nitrosopumilales archaeon]|nr:MAG: AsnC family transcription regulator [Nitrosopumilales archaeon]